ncbi:MAG: phage tail protein, partial [Myxococcales bacterium]|nr:phage tail protein [Myxococcales bacterium]
MAVIGNPRSFHKKFKFIVEIDDIGHAGFQTCSELSVEVANVQHFEGGSLIPNKSPGRPTFGVRPRRQRQRGRRRFGADPRGRGSQSLLRRDSWGALSPWCAS